MASIIPIEVRVQPTVLRSEENHPISIGGFIANNSDELVELLEGNS